MCKCKVNTIEQETKRVIKLMKKDYPTVHDYNVITDDEVHLLDKDDKTITIINGDALTKYWNIMEGWS